MEIKVTVEDIEKCVSTYDIGEAVELAAEQCQYIINTSLTYAEEAEQIGDEHPLYDILIAAEKRWFDNGVV